jgi:hypothetical protein
MASAVDGPLGSEFFRAAMSGGIPLDEDDEPTGARAMDTQSAGAHGRMLGFTWSSEHERGLCVQASHGSGKGAAPAAAGWIVPAKDATQSIADASSWADGAADGGSGMDMTS